MCLFNAYTSTGWLNRLLSDVLSKHGNVQEMKHKLSAVHWGKELTESPTPPCPETKTSSALLSSALSFLVPGTELHIAPFLKGLTIKI